MMLELTQTLLNYFRTTAVALAQEAGVILKKKWGHPHDVQHKAWIGDLVTEVDKESEALIIASLKKHFPYHSILSEEAGLQEELERGDFLWVIDPLDGTTNYTHGHPMVSISIGLLFRQTPIVGVVYNPIHEEMFVGAYGLGATLNNQPIRVSQVARLSESLLATGFAYDRCQVTDTNYPEFCHITHLTQGVRREGSAALDLAYVAAGRLDGYWERGVRIWDIAAGVVIIREAGGQVTAYDQSPLDLTVGRLLATNGLIHQELSEALVVASERVKIIFS